MKPLTTYKHRIIALCDFIILFLAAIGVFAIACLIVDKPGNGAVVASVIAVYALNMLPYWIE